MRHCFGSYQLQVDADMQSGDLLSMALISWQRVRIWPVLRDGGLFLFQGFLPIEATLFTMNGGRGMERKFQYLQSATQGNGEDCSSVPATLSMEGVHYKLSSQMGGVG